MGKWDAKDKPDHSPSYAEAKMSHSLFYSRREVSIWTSKAAAYNTSGSQQAVSVPLGVRQLLPTGTHKKYCKKYFS